MWIIYYLNHKRIGDISYQINSQIIKEERKTKKKIVGVQGKGKFGLSKFLSKFINPELEGSVDSNIQSDNEQIIQYPELDQKTKIALDYFAEQKNFVEIGENTTKKLRVTPNKLIKFSGMFHPHISGNSYSERLAKYEKSKNITWSGKCGEITVKFYTGKSSIISNTPIHPALETKSGKIYLDGFGTFSQMNNSNLTITPLILGTQII